MRKEAKIGLAVILILVITFGVVLARRLSDPSDSAAKSSLREKAQSTAQLQGAPPAKNSQSKPPGSAIKRPTVVSAKAASTRTPKHSPAAASQWSVASDRNKATPRSGAGQPKSTPPFPMPKPPAPVQADPYARYANPQQSPLPWPAEQTGPRGTGAVQPYDPFPSRPAQTTPDQTFERAPAGTDPSGRGPNRLRVLGPPDQTGLRPGTGGQGHSARARYPTGIPNAGQMPTYRQSTRQSYRAASLPPAAPQQFTISNNRAGLGPQLDANNLRREDGSYEVQPNDSYWMISRRLYGSGAYFKALAEHNRSTVSQEDRLEVGELIWAPDLAELEKTYPELCPKPRRRTTTRNQASSFMTGHQYTAGRPYTVEQGDTLFDIARYELGKASRWAEIHELNRDVLGDDYDYLVPGTQLLLPDNGKVPDSVTRRPDAKSVYQR